MGLQSNLPVTWNNIFVFRFHRRRLILGGLLVLKEGVGEHLNFQLRVHIFDLLTVVSLSNFANGFSWALHFHACRLHSEELNVGAGRLSWISL